MEVDGRKNIEEVDGFLYLGSIIATHGGTQFNIKSRIIKAQHTFELIRNVWSSV